jgi:hypothetical protein
MNDLLPETSNIWQQDFLLELALGLEPDVDIMARYDVTPVQLNQWYEHPVFKKELSELRKKVLDEGLTFKVKCRVQAEQYLLDIHNVMKDKSTPPNTKLEILRSLSRWAGYDPKDDKKESTTVNVNVNQIGNLVQSISNTSRDLVPPEQKEIRAKSWRNE